MKRLFAVLALVAAAVGCAPLKAQDRVVDRKFVILQGSYLAMGVLDTELTQACIRAHTCHEGNPWMPSSQAGQLGVVFGMTAASTALGYYLRKHDFAAWWAPTSVGIGTHLIGAASGAKIDFQWRFTLP